MICLLLPLIVTYLEAEQILATPDIVTDVVTAPMTTFVTRKDWHLYSWFVMFGLCGVTAGCEWALCSVMSNDDPNDNRMPREEWEVL